MNALLGDAPTKETGSFEHANQDLHTSGEAASWILTSQNFEGNELMHIDCTCFVPNSKIFKPRFNPETKMQGTIINFRRSRKRTYPNHMIIAVDGVNKKEGATKLVGKKVVFNTGKKNISGRVSSAHGNKGAVRAIFESGMPGQAIGKKVKIE